MEKILLTYKYPFLGQAFLIGSFISYFLSLFLKKYQMRTLILGSTFLWLSYFLITFCFIIGDFSIQAVVGHSAKETPLLYKIVGVWGSGSGSFLLWISFLSLTFIFIKNIHVAMLFALQMIGFIVFQQLTFPVFETVSTLMDGQDLNPLLQDHSMVIHPPILYCGQVFLAYIFFSQLDINSNINKVFRLISIGFSLLTLGILLGSIWAYYELGWGGFWYWDPVEIISLFPWIIYLTTLHSYHLRQTHIFYLLCLLGWPITLLGMALVRSGLLNSVHSFSENPGFLLNFFIVFFTTLIPCFLYIQKTQNNHQRKDRMHFSWLSFLCLWAGIFLILVLSVLLPIFMPSLYFSPVFFQNSIWPMMIPLLALMGMTPYKNYIFQSSYRKIIILSFILLFLCVYDYSVLPLLASLTISLCVIGSVATLLQFINNKPLSRRSCSIFLGHLGWQLLISSCVIVSFLSREDLIIFNNDHKQTSKTGEILTIDQIQEIKGENYVGHMATIRLYKKDELNTPMTLKPQLKYFITAKATHSEMALTFDGFSQICLILEKVDKNIIHIRIYHKKFILGVWLGGLLLILGGILFFIKRSDKKSSPVGL